MSAKLVPELPVSDHAATWYRAGGVDAGNCQHLVRDPDGYLLRFFEDLGTQAAPTAGRIVG